MIIELRKTAAYKRKLIKEIEAELNSSSTLTPREEEVDNDFWFREIGFRRNSSAVDSYFNQMSISSSSINHHQNEDR